MAGFTALSERLGPEEAYSVMDQIYEILIHKVHDYEGTVNEMTGDGIIHVPVRDLRQSIPQNKARRKRYTAAQNADRD
jgi:class 3 adenylate cyclase